MITTFFQKILSVLFPPCCYGCHKNGFTLCNQCLKLCRKALNTPALYITSMYSFKDPLIKRAIHSIKYFHRKDLVQPLTTALAEEITKIIQQQNQDIKWVLLPIPMPRLRKYTRGYNQAEVIAKELSKQCDLQVHTKILTRSHTYKRQVMTHTRRERLTNQHNTFKVTQDVKGLGFILVDDVTTTGATLSEARALLLSAGAKKVVAVTIAH